MEASVSSDPDWSRWDIGNTWDKNGGPWFESEIRHLWMQRTEGLSDADKRLYRDPAKVAVSGGFPTADSVRRASDKTLLKIEGMGKTRLSYLRELVGQ